MFDFHQKMIIEYDFFFDNLNVNLVTSLINISISIYLWSKCWKNELDHMDYLNSYVKSYEHVKCEDFFCNTRFQVWTLIKTLFKTKFMTLWTIGMIDTIRKVSNRLDMY